MASMPEGSTRTGNERNRTTTPEGSVSNRRGVCTWAISMAITLCSATNLWAVDTPEPKPAAQETKDGAAPTIQNGMAVQLNYTLTVDGAVMDSTEGQSPLKYIHGQGQLIPGLERQLTGLKAGDTGQFTITPEEGYGSINSEAFLKVPREKLPADMTPEVGMMVEGRNPDGQPLRARIHAVDDKMVTLDFNHPLAGKTLQFTVTVVSISPGPS